MVALLCTALSAIGFYFSIGLGSVWWLAWLAPIPVLWLAYSGAPRGVVFAACWTAYALGSCNMLPAYLGWLPLPTLLVAILVPGIGLGLVSLSSRMVAERLSPLAGVLTFAALWTSVDYLVSFGPDGTAGSWSNSQVGAPLLIQAASLFGLWAIEFVLTFFAAGIAMTLATGSPAPALAAAALFAVNAGFGAWRIEVAPRTTPVIHVGLAAFDRGAFLRGDYPAALAALDAYSVAGAQLAADRPSLIVFPEKIARLDGRARVMAIARLQRLSQNSGAVVVMGFNDRTTVPPHNTALIARPDGSIGVYDKRHMVPGLENEFAIGRGGFALPDGTGVVICKDMDFPGTLRRDARHFRPTLMAVPAWDFYGDAWWHARLAILRGVENGFAVARSAKDGLLTLTDAYGQIWLADRSSERRMIQRSGTVPRGPGPTLYTAIGDVFAWVCLAISALLLGLAGVRPRREPGA